MIAYDGCNKCAYVAESDQGQHCGRCVHNCTDQFKNATRADRIRNMTDEELVKMLIKYQVDEKLQFCKSIEECTDILDESIELPDEMCEKCLLEWLRESDGLE